MAKLGRSLVIVVLILGRIPPAPERQVLPAYARLVAYVVVPVSEGVCRDRNGGTINFREAILLKYGLVSGCSRKPTIEMVDIKRLEHDP